MKQNQVMRKGETMENELKDLQVIAKAAILIGRHHITTPEWRKWADGFLAGSPPHPYPPAVEQGADNSPAISAIAREISEITSHLAEATANPDVMASRQADADGCFAFFVDLVARIELSAADLASIWKAEYSTTAGDMWVHRGFFPSRGKAEAELADYARAGNLTRVLECAPGSPAHDAWAAEILLAERVKR